MGECPDWYGIIIAAEKMHTHPAIVAGIPETMGAYCWTNWRLIVSAAIQHASGPEGKAQSIWQLER